METRSSSAARYYRPELDVVRLFAFLLVFLFHALPGGPDPRSHVNLKAFGPILYAIANAGRFGLCLFFTLSAFLIFELLTRERQAAGTVVVKQFYVRRILRIWPLYYLGLALGLVVALLPGGDRANLSVFPWLAVFLGSWRFSVIGAIKNPVTPLWSISVEEQFYLLAPWVAKYFNRQAVYVFCGLLIVSANAWLYYFGTILAPDYRIWFDSFVQFQCFAAGILLSLILHGRMPRLAWWQRLSLLAASLGGWFFAAYSLHARFGPGGNPGSLDLIASYALGTIGSVLILIAAMGIDPGFFPRWCIYLGRISFGLYVFHEFSIDLLEHTMPHVGSMKSPLYPLKGLLALLITFLAAAISYRYFETPFLKMKKRHAIIESQPIEGAN